MAVFIFMVPFYGKRDAIPQLNSPRVAAASHGGVSGLACSVWRDLCLEKYVIKNQMVDKIPLHLEQ
jgi:hypothetical protein